MDLWSTRKDRAMSVRCARKRGRCQCRQESEGKSGLTGNIIGVRRCLRVGELDGEHPGGGVVDEMGGGE
jgi:hypothetical protein